MITSKRNKIFFTIIFLLLLMLNCNKEKVIEIKDPLGDWPDYIDIKVIDKTIVEKEKIYPHVIFLLSKVSKEKLYSITFDYYYEYGYQYFSKGDKSIFSFNSDEIKILNSNQELKKEYTFEECKKLQIEGYNDYDIYNPPKSKIVNTNNMILYGLKIGASIKQIKIIK